jgi:hypothetical protein
MLRLLLSATAAAGQWVGPLTGSYNSACVDVANEGPFDPSVALNRCQQLCAANPKCNAMNYGNPPPHVGCSLRNCPTQSALANPTGGVIPAVHAYYCNASRAAGFCSTPLAVVLRSVYADHMVMQHGVAGRIIGSVPGVEQGANVTVELDGVTIGTGVTDAAAEFDVTIAAQPVSSKPHVVTVNVESAVRLQTHGSNPHDGKTDNGMSSITPATIRDVLFGEQFFCSGQSNMGLSVQQSNNASAEIAAASWPLIRITSVKAAWDATVPQNDTAFSIPWGAISSKNIGSFSGLCYYFGRNMFQGTSHSLLRPAPNLFLPPSPPLYQGLGGLTPVGLIEQASGGSQ